MNSEIRIKHTLDEAHVDSEPRLDQQILVDAWRAGQRGRQIHRRLLLCISAILVLGLTVSVALMTEKQGIRPMQENTTMMRSDRWTLGAATIRYRQEGMKGLERFSIPGRKRSELLPPPLSIQRVLAELEE